jgi:hypothetical protein
MAILGSLQFHKFINQPPEILSGIVVSLNINLGRKGILLIFGENCHLANI